VCTKLWRAWIRATERSPHATRAACAHAAEWSCAPRNSEGQEAHALGRDELAVLDRGGARRGAEVPLLKVWMLRVPAGGVGVVEVLAREEAAAEDAVRDEADAVCVARLREVEVKVPVQATGV
jgi:hypothetical protein